MKIVFDIEANGLYDKADTVWCLSIKEAIKGSESPVESFVNSSVGKPFPSIERGLERLSEASELIGHNIINYDLPLLKKLYNWEPNENTKISDTFIMSCTLYPDRTRPPGYTGKGGPHSLECWGYRVSKAKPHHERWDVYSSAMLSRNRSDVEINNRVYHTLKQEMVGWDWESCLDLEHSIAKIITDQEHYGVHFDVAQAKKYVEYLESKMSAIDDELLQGLPKKVKQRGTTVLEPFNANGTHTARYREDISYCSGPFTRVSFELFDLGSTKQVKDYLLSNGWRPEEWNYSPKTGERTSPKLSGAFDGIEGILPKKIKERIKYRHRKSQIEGWINNIRPDGRLPAGAITAGTNTGRMRHTTVVNVPKANSDKSGELIWDTSKQKDFFGTQMRSLFSIEDKKNYVLVGHDAKGLELRMLAHYMKDKDYIEAILHGDIHGFNQTAAGLATRDGAKSFIYAFLYGAGDEKLGDVTGGTKNSGRKLRLKFLSSLPMLDRLIRSVKRAAGKGWIKGLDGRKVWMRHDSSGDVMTHKALNTLLQHSGSILMKKSSDILWGHLVPQNNVRAFKVLDMHDECQAEVHKEDVELYSKLAVQSIKDAGEFFNLEIPMDADVKIGTNWAETH
jgi:DNA polymerase-1